MSKYQSINNLKVSEKLLSFVNDQLLSDTNIAPKDFWSGFDKAVHELTPKNKELIQIRDDLQKKIDDWHIQNKGNEIDLVKYKNFLKDIGYLKDEGDDFHFYRLDNNNFLYQFYQRLMQLFFYRSSMLNRYI